MLHTDHQKPKTENQKKKKKFNDNQENTIDSNKSFSQLLKLDNQN